MAEHELSPEQAEFYQWLEELDLDRTLSDLIENPAAIEIPQFSSEELERLEGLGRDYAHELFDRDAIPDLPPLDIDERLLEPEVPQDPDHDFDRDR